jgi:hypothetical protein
MSLLIETVAKKHDGISLSLTLRREVLMMGFNQCMATMT